MLRRLFLLVPILLWAGCDDAADPSSADAFILDMATGCPVGATRCAGDGVEICLGGVWVDDVMCTADQQCVDGQCVAVECVPDCAGRACGDDGCGASCGACEGAAFCGDDGQCALPDPTCGDGVCGADETCVSCARDCGCADPETCDAQTEECMACTPQCDGRECGDDGCGGTCGVCDGAACDDGLCAMACTPTCDGRACGDDGCDGVCGACDGEQVCDAVGACVAPPPACGDGQCGDGEDCSTCPQDCGDCCGDGQCAAGENCVACAADCACPDGERCAEDRRACVVECVPQCDGRNCGDDGCGGDCGDCAGAQACEAGVCVDVCQPDCTDRVCGGDGCLGRCGECDAGSACDDGACEAVCQPQCDDLECGDDGCGGVCGVCEGGQTCHRVGACRAPLVIDAPGVYPREGPRDEGRLVLIERSMVTLRLSSPAGGCMVLNRIIMQTADGDSVTSARDTVDRPCATLSLPLNPGEYLLLFEYFDHDPAYTITAEFEPISDVIDGPGVFERLTTNGDDALTIQVAEPIVLAIIPRAEAPVCPLSATLELTQDGQVLGSGVSRRGGDGCGRLLVQLQPGAYDLQFYSDDPDQRVERYTVHVAMTPMGPAVLDDDATIGRPGALPGDFDEITLNIPVPSIVRFRLEDGLGNCVAYRWGRNQPDVHNRAHCNEYAQQFPHEGGELTLFLDADAGLQPYVLRLDLEPIPTGSAFLPRSSILRPDTDGDFVFVFVEEPSRVDFVLEGMGAPCESGIDRARYDGYRSVPGGAGDGPCAWSELLDPGLHGFKYFAAELPLGVPLDRRVTVTPLDLDYAGPGVYPRARSLELESFEFVLDAPQVFRVTAQRRNGQGCIPYDFALVLEDGRRVEPEDANCSPLMALLPAGTHRFERQGVAVDFHFEYGETFEGSGPIERPETGILGEMLHLIGPPEAVLYISQYVDGICPPMGALPEITAFDGTRDAFDCQLVGYRGLNGHAMLFEAGRIAARMFTLRWDVPRPLPFDVQHAEDVPFQVATAIVDAPGLVVAEHTPCGDGLVVRGLGGPRQPWAQETTALARCATAFFATPGLFALTQPNPNGAQTWSVSQPANPLAVPEQRPVPRIPFDGTYSAPITADRAGRLHVALTVDGGNCFLANNAWHVVGEGGGQGQRVRQCEKVIVTQVGQGVGVIISPPAGVAFSGVISTWWE